MLYTIIVLIGIQITSLFAFSIFLKRLLTSKQEAIETHISETIQDWIRLQGENRDQPSKLAMMLDGMGAVVGSAAARSLMASVKAGTVGENAMANTQASFIEAQQNPILALLQGGKKGKGAAVMRLAQLLGPMLSGSGNGHAESSGPSVRDRLGR